MERREMLKGAVLATTAGLLTLTDAEAHHDEVKHMELFTKEDKLLLKEIMGLRNYYIAVMKATDKDNLGTWPAISIPMATEPISMYVRKTEWQDKVTPPGIPLIHEWMTERTHPDKLNLVVNALAYRLRLVPKQSTVVDKITLRSPTYPECKPDRIVSPKYVCDTEELHFGEAVTANILCWIVGGLWQEWRDRVKTAVTAFKGNPDNTGSPRVKSQHKHIELHFGSGPKFLYEVFGSMVTYGFIPNAKQEPKKLENNHEPS